jgi:hypothetical protein
MHKVLSEGHAVDTRKGERPMAKQPKKEHKEETPYCYYVCFQSLKAGQSQVSCSIIKRARPIDSEKEVGDLVQFLLHANQLQAVIPINWILLAPGTVPAVTTVADKPCR